MSREWSGTGSTPHRAPSRTLAAAVLVGAAVLVALLLIGLGFAMSGFWTSDPQPQSNSGPSPAARDTDSATRSEQELVTRPMLLLPPQASLPHVLADKDPGAPMVLPVPAAVNGQLVPGGFPASPEGAVAQLVALTRSGVAGGDPAVYDTAYDSLSESGAPPAASSFLHQQLVELRSHGQLRPTGPVPGLTIGWTPTSGLIKGTTSAGSLVAVCVLGQLDVDYQGRVASAGVGDCQAMRRVDGAWWIAAGPAAATAPSAWPGSSEAVSAGYRDLR